MKIWGPSTKESAAAMYVAVHASELVDAIIENRLTSDFVKRVVETLYDLRGEIVADYPFEERAEQLSDDWDKSEYSEENKRLVMEVPK